ncbi:MAG: maleylpyruvate isomerase N-terminal domain-containing protein [Mycobacterium sp.]
MEPDDIYLRAARDFAALIHRIPGGAWDGPGLGEWDLGALVGHTSRSLTTVVTYFATPADRVDVEDAVEYYRVATEMCVADPGGVVQRGRAAGQDLGGDPAGKVDALVAMASRSVAEHGGGLVAVLGGLGMRPTDYLPTRVFELAVHSLDIAAATGLPLELDPAVAVAATDLAVRIAVATGRGEVVLRALTGRAPLPAPFSVTP